MLELSVTSVPVFISGEWREIPDVATGPVFNPSRGEVIAEVPMCGKEHVDEFVLANRFPCFRARSTPA